MSESSNYGESSIGGGESSSSRYSPSVTQKQSISDSKKVNFNLVKQKLKAIETEVTKDLDTNENTQFTQLFRKMIIDNETEVTNFPTTSFFISKFEELNTSQLSEDLKTKVLSSLYSKQFEDKKNNSKLKYW